MASSSPQAPPRRGAVPEAMALRPPDRVGRAAAPTAGSDSARSAAACNGTRERARPKYPQGQGFIAPTSMNRAGKIAVRAARAIRDAALFQRLAQHLQHAALELRHLVEEQHAVVREADFARPRLRAAADQRDVRDRVVRRPKRPRASRPAPGGSSPATEWIAVTSSASSKVSGGRIPGSRRAIIVLPAPGGPTSSRLCPPAAAISSARRASVWPRTSAKSPCRSRDAAASACGRDGARPAARSGAFERARRLGERRDRDDRRSPPTTAASRGIRRAAAAGPPSRRAARQPQSAGRRAPAESAPSSDSSPSSIQSSICAPLDQALGGENAERDRQVERRAGLAHVGRRQVDGDAVRRETRSRNCGWRCAPGRGFRARWRRASPTIVKTGQAERHVDLDVDRTGFDAEDGGGSAAWRARVVEGVSCKRRAAERDSASAVALGQRQSDHGARRYAERPPVVRRSRSQQLQ